MGPKVSLICRVVSCTDEWNFEPQTHRSGNGPVAPSVVWCRGRIYGNMTASKQERQHEGRRNGCGVCSRSALMEHISFLQRLEARPERSRAKRMHVVDRHRDLSLLVTEALRNIQPHPLTIPRRRVIHGSQ